MLWKCLIQYKGTNEYVEELRHSEGALKIDTSEVQSSVIKLFRYKSVGMLPSLIITSPVDGKRYMVPEWIEVHPKTTLNDIVRIGPKLQVKEKPQVYKIKDYVIKYNPDKKMYTCNCQGYFRVKDRSVGCKHIQEIKKNLAS